MAAQELSCKVCQETIRVPDLSKIQRETIASLCVSDSVKIFRQKALLAKTRSGRSGFQEFGAMCICFSAAILA
jgi:hypothetical protein